MIYKDRDTDKIVPVPLHGKNKKIKIGTFLKIIKQSELDKSKFE